MAEFEVVTDQVNLLKSWSSAIPGPVQQVLGDITPLAVFGERHGSWILRVSWTAAGMSRRAELAVTNMEVVPDGVANRGVISVRASASTDDRFVAETIYEGPRSVRRISRQQLTDWLVSATQQAVGYTPTSLANSYATGVETTSDTSGSS